MAASASPSDDASTPKVLAAASEGAKASGASRPAPEPRCLGVPMKYVSLISLTLQTSAQVFVIKWARQGAAAADSPPYLASTVVLFTEMVKMSVSLVLVAISAGSLGGTMAEVNDHLLRNKLELLKISVPSLLYTVQNNLMFFSLLKLSAAVQQVTYQLKILTTALLSVVMLGRVLNPTKWIALLVLLVGVVLVQWPSPGTLPAAKAKLSGDTMVQGNTEQAKTLDMGGAGVSSFGLVFEYDALLGFGAVLVACFTSGFASVYLEKLLKQTDASIWMRNVQLGIFGTIMALGVAWLQDGERILEGGMLQGYNWRVLCVVLTNALGGLLCAAVLKYADNILRCFSTALSIILTCLLSAGVLHEYQPDVHFLLGTFLAIAATFLYSLGAPQQLTKVMVELLRRAKTLPGPSVSGPLAGSTRRQSRARVDSSAAAERSSLRWPSLRGRPSAVAAKCK